MPRKKVLFFAGKKQISKRLKSCGFGGSVPALPGRLRVAEGEALAGLQNAQFIARGSAKPVVYFAGSVRPIPNRLRPDPKQPGKRLTSGGLAAFVVGNSKLLRKS